VTGTIRFWYWLRLLAVPLLIAAVASCDATHEFDDGTAVAGLTSQDDLEVGDLDCDSHTIELPDEAIIWRVTGDRDEPVALLWRGHRVETTPRVVPSSGLHLFAASEFVEGPLGLVSDLRTVGDEIELDVVLVSRGGAHMLMSTARAHPDGYLFGGQTGTFDELQRAHCAPTGT
jgi:hypothetical protein